MSEKMQQFIEELEGKRSHALMVSIIPTGGSFLDMTHSILTADSESRPGHPSLSGYEGPAESANS